LVVRRPGDKPVSEVIYPYYLAVWRHILVGWLGWPEERLATWVGAWADRIERNIHGYREWFYHEDELHYVLPLLVPDALADRMSKQRTGRMYNDLAGLLYEELQPAITGRPRHASWGTETFDWEFAKERVEAVLGRYGAGLPEPEQTSAYERRIVGRTGA
jgi:hypothetical protein